MQKIPKPPLLVITDSGLAEGRLLAIVEECLAAGCRWFMVREKNMPLESLIKLTISIAKMAEKYSAAVVVNGYPEIVNQTGAAGVHLPWSMDIKAARRVVGGDKLLGVSTHSTEQAVEAEKMGADYVTLSPIFPSVSKPGYQNPAGLQMLKDIVRRLTIPVIALGGIKPGNAKTCIANGAAGVAVLGAMMKAQKPYDVILSIINEIKPTQ
ncbi:thiamine-phosphate pyrophosphorylase [Candidatus Caldarchaeum subterraneum]|uniref:Thiamine-phosphate synthase n=1 Tax=Caldiarchaeum subterraneum TaxID=311458 RepID=E6N704_CALS0|nr:thiamine-phosphate pyrophosphorylase [Candidatus Caldarchaeum subterraneum]BAJ50863.1 thiamine-phosphate pyrophosphorylase [Candidatus Caldarchaeum subterraneum]